MDYIYSWSEEKNLVLKKERNVSFEDIMNYINGGYIINIIPNENYKNQEIFIINHKDYIYLVPFVKDGNKIFLKTIIPSRKATKKYLKGDDENEVK